MTYRVTLVQSDEGYAVWADELRGCASQGATRDEAIENIRMAIREWLEAQPDREQRFGTKISHAEVAV